MDFRVIRLFGATLTSSSLLAEVRAWYVAETAGDNFKVCADGGGYSKVDISLQALIAKTQLLEWETRLDSLTREIAEVATGLRLPNKDLLKALTDNGGTLILRLYDRVTDSVEQRYVLSALDRLKSVWGALLSRDTLFVLPDDVRPTEAELKVLNMIAVGALQGIASDGAPHYSFVSSHQYGRTRSGAHVGHYTEFISLLQIKSSDIQATNLNAQKNEALLDEEFRKQGPLVLEGDTGTGKSMTARLLAKNSNKNMLYINISAIPKDLIESRIRGYLKGTFTGADKDMPGWFEKADGDVLFLDEFQNASLEVQTQLLDLLNPVSNMVVVPRMGEEDNHRVYNVKVVLALNESVETLLSSNRIRKDFFYRIRACYTFKSLANRMARSDEEEKEVSVERINHFIRRVMYVYRWKSAPVLYVFSDGNPVLYKEDNLGFKELRSLFPVFSDDLLTLIRRGHSWPGNFREFEVFAFDIYWIMDMHGRNLDKELILSWFTSRKLSYKSEEKSNEVDDTLIRKIRFVEAVLAEARFVINNAIPKLKAYKLGSPQALKNFIREHEELFSASFISDSKIQRVLNGTFKLQSKH